LLNYTSVQTSGREGDHWNCCLIDDETDAPLQVQAKCIVNAAGAWAQGFAQSHVKLRLTKGVHIVIDRARLNVPDAVVMAQGKRILFAIPWGERLILGTTDTDYSGPLDSPDCDDDDIRYILEVTNYTFPSAAVSKDDIISAWSGLRPLISAGQKGTPSDISRAHVINEPQEGWIDVSGGKLTTYRLMAEQTVDRVMSRTGATAIPCTTATTPLVPASPATGTPGEGWGGGFSGILPPQVSQQAVAHFCQNEWAMHLSDVMIRRSSWRYYHRDHIAIAQQAAGWMQRALGWSDEQRDAEIRAYREETETLCGGKNKSSSPKVQHA
jgi:glycerol-3-phosphate dehydrogenase